MSCRQLGRFRQPRQRGSAVRASARLDGASTRGAHAPAAYSGQNDKTLEGLGVIFGI